jgi:general secretion pathway protein D
MDGNVKTSFPAATLATTVILLACCWCDCTVRADVPPLFVGEGVSQPIDVLPAPAAQEVAQAPASDSQLIRPRARLIQVNQPQIRVLSGTATEATSSSPDTVGSLSPAQTISVEEALDTKGSITFRKTPLSEVVFLLSELWHINIVAGENISGEVSGAFHDAPLREVLSAALTAAGYSYRRTGNSLVVLPADQVGADNPDFVSEMLALPADLRDAESSLAAAQLLLSERGQLQKVGDHGLLVIDSNERVQRIRQLFTELTPEQADIVVDEQPADDAEQLASTTAVTRSGIAYFSPQFTEASEMAQSLQDALGPGVTVAIYAEENRIMVKGTPEDLRIAAEAIEQLDRARPQVRITAMIYDVSLKEVERLGINWSVRPHSQSVSLADMNDPATLRFRNAASASTGLITDTAVPGAGSLAISTLNNNINVDALLQALDSNNESKLLADPSITVGDRRKASIRIVQKIPIRAADPVENTGVVFSQVQFEEAGVILNVQPRIGRDGTIELIVEPEYSVVADFIGTNPVIDSRTAQTTVRVADGQTFAIGGLRQKSLVETTRGVPGLRDIKYIGKLFRSHDTEIRESELIVFLRPEIVTPYCTGTQREQTAAIVSQQMLDAIPHADQAPQIPCCKDKSCPNHHPRPRINGGSSSLDRVDGMEVHGVEVHGVDVHSIEVHEAQSGEISEPQQSNQEASTNLLNQATELERSSTAQRPRVAAQSSRRRVPGVVIKEVKAF